MFVQVGDLLPGDHAAVDDGAGEGRVFGAEQVAAHGGADAVRGHHEVGSGLGAVGQRDEGAVVVLADRGHLGAEVEGARRHRVDHHPLQVRPEQVELGRPEALLHRRPERGPVQERPVVPAQQVHGVGNGTDATQLLADADLVEEPHRVGPDRQRRSRRVGLGRPLEDVDLDPAPIERQRRRQPADAATDDRRLHRDRDRRGYPIPLTP
jgi:hypothetical protein